MTEYNHNRPLSDFMPDIEALRSFGYKPIAVTMMLLEDTFVFETAEEATRAYNQFELNDSDHKISAWWYGKDDFLKEVEKYESELGVKVLVYDLIKPIVPICTFCNTEITDEVSYTEDAEPCHLSCLENIEGYLDDSFWDDGFWDDNKEALDLLGY